MDIDLYFGDCLDKLRTIPDKSIDLVVTDPPYELHTGGAGFMRDRPFWSELQELNIDKGFNEKVLSELVRVMRDINMYIWVSKKQLLPTFDYFAKSLGCSWTLLTWHKANPAPTINNKYLSDTEYCIFFKRGGVRLYGDYSTKSTYYTTMINKSDKDKFMHPTIKPLHIIKNLIINSSQKGETVLDPFMGSGTTGVACKLLDRNFIGCEINETYYNIAKERIEPNTTNLLF